MSDEPQTARIPTRVPTVLAGRSRTAGQEGVFTTNGACQFLGHASDNAVTAHDDAAIEMNWSLPYGNPLSK